MTDTDPAPKEAKQLPTGPTLLFVLVFIASAIGIASYLHERERQYLTQNCQPTGKTRLVERTRRSRKKKNKQYQYTCKGQIKWSGVNPAG